MHESLCGRATANRHFPDSPARLHRRAEFGRSSGPPKTGDLLRFLYQGEVIEINTGDARKRAAFAQRQAQAQTDLARLFRSAGIDAIQLRTDLPYAVELARFFETREKRRLRG